MVASSADMEAGVEGGHLSRVVWRVAAAVHLLMNAFPAGRWCSMWLLIIS
jgi:hypothetical protein